MLQKDSVGARLTDSPVYRQSFLSFILLGYLVYMAAANRAFLNERAGGSDVEWHIHAEFFHARRQQRRRTCEKESVTALYGLSLFLFARHKTI